MNCIYYLLAVEKYAGCLNELSAKVPKHRACFQSYAIICAWSVDCICHYIEIVHVGHSDQLMLWQLLLGLAFADKALPSEPL
jgi:hypothetical protein